MTDHKLHGDRRRQAGAMPTLAQACSICTDQTAKTTESTKKSNRIVVENCCLYASSIARLKCVGVPPAGSVKVAGAGSYVDDWRPEPGDGE